MNEYKDPGRNTTRRQLESVLSSEIKQRNRSIVTIDGYRRAAVLAPVVSTEFGWELLFTVRSKQLANHAGQIAFPGGSVDPGETLEQAASRETFEEIGITPESIIGALDDHPSPAGFVVTPFVGFLPWPATVILDAGEVDSYFTVPIAELAKIEPRVETRTDRGLIRTLHYYDCGDRMIWGLTANIVHNVLELIGPQPLS